MKSMVAYSAVLWKVLFSEHHLKQVLFHGFSPEVWFIMVRKKGWNCSLSVSQLHGDTLPKWMCSHPWCLLSIPLHCCELLAPKSPVSTQPERLQSTKHNWMPSQALIAWTPLHDPSAVLLNLSSYAIHPWVLGLTYISTTAKWSFLEFDHAYAS